MGYTSHRSLPGKGKGPKCDSEERGGHYEPQSPFCPSPSHWQPLPRAFMPVVSQYRQSPLFWTRADSRDLFLSTWISFLLFLIPQKSMLVTVTDTASQQTTLNKNKYFCLSGDLKRLLSRMCTQDVYMATILVP